MYFIKLLENDEVIGAEQLEVLEYVRQDTRENIIRSSGRNAQGIISLDGSCVYQLDGKDAMSGNFKTAVFINGDEYSEIVTDTDSDLEDEIPDEGVIMTREELTAKVTELEEQNAMLMECLMEMSEIVYA